MWHSTLELWTKDAGQDPKEIFMHVAAKNIEDMKKRYRKRVGTNPSEEEVGLVYDHVDIGRSMIDAYKEKWGSAIPGDYGLVQMDQTFLIDIPGTEHQLQGTMDGLLQNNKDEFVILERKTYGARPRLDLLNHNDQFLAYKWAVWQLTGTPPAGMLYDGAWKRKLEGKRTLDDLFMRVVLERPVSEMEEFGRLLQLEVADMTSDPNIYINRQWMGCIDCPFTRLCDAQSADKDFEYVRSTFFVEKEEEEPDDFTSNDE